MCNNQLNDLFFPPPVLRVLLQTQWGQPVTRQQKKEMECIQQTQNRAAVFFSFPAEMSSRSKTFSFSKHL